MSTTTARRARAGIETAPSLWYAAPALLLFAAFGIVPILAVLGLSFTTWNGLGPIELQGFESWQQVLGSSVTLNALAVTGKIMLFSLIVQLPLSLLLGTWTAGPQRSRAALAVVFFVPLLLSSAAIAIAFKSLLDPNFGIGPASGIELLGQNWLGSPDLVLFVVVFVIAWQFIPFHTLIYQGGVKQIPASLYEAAELDGAGRVRRFLSVTVPQLKYTIITSTTLMVVGSLTYFDLIFVLTAGGPGYETRLLPLHMYLTGFEGTAMGAASALGVILVVIGLVLALLLQRLGGRDRTANQTEGM